MSPSDQMDALVRSDPPVMIAAFCPTCGGWTMFVASNSDNAIDWMRRCYAAGDLIMKTAASNWGPPCPQVDEPLSERTCDLNG